MRIIEPRADEVLYLPLGGAGEIGMNAYLYGHKGAWLLVDLGVTFGDPASTPGVDLLTPDITLLESLGRKLKGLVVTHAHEDHFGAIPYLADALDCPLYATPFAANLLRRKLDEAGAAQAVRLHPIDPGGRFQVADFDLQFLPVTHSIPQAQGLVIRTEAGVIYHSGDWKIDPEPLLGAPFDPEPLKALGENGLLALMGDSTNAVEPGHSGREADAAKGLAAQIAEAGGRVAVTCFATNVARVNAVAEIARTAGRSICLLGRSLRRMTEVAREEGLIGDFVGQVSEADLEHLPPEQQLLLCTGSQGEPRAALARLARGENPSVQLGAGDRVILSARTIPGNEEAVAEVLNRLAARDVEIITETEARVHVSGHAKQDEIAQLIRWTRPQNVIPLHGEQRHLRAHAELARRLQVPSALVAPNGSLVRLQSGQPASIIATLPTGRWGLDGQRFIDMQSPLVRARKKLNHSGLISLAVHLDKRGELVAPPSVAAQGLYDEAQDGDILAALADSAAHLLQRLSRAELGQDAVVTQSLIRELRRSARQLIGKKPLVVVHIMRQ